MKKSPKVRLIELQNGGIPFEELLRERFAQGKSPREVGPEFDMHFTQIYRWARSLGVAVPGRSKVAP